MDFSDKDLKKLSREDLLRMLIEQKKENERLQAKIAELEDRLESKRILISKAGTMAEASMQINQVFEAVDKAAQQYLENVKFMGELYLKGLKERDEDTEL